MNNHRIKGLVLVLVLSLFPFNIHAQEEDYLNPERCLERRGLEYGAIAGFYFADQGTADFYSGKRENENNVDYLLKNEFRYKEIYDLLNVNDTVFVMEYPQKMKYNPSFSFGLFAKYDLDCRSSIYLQFSYAKLVAKDAVSFEVDPKDYLTEPDIRLYPIYGTEERNMVDLGFTHAFGNNRVARFLIGGGINMNNTLVKEHILRIEDKPYSLVNVYGNNSYIPGGTQQAYEIRQGGIGFGIFGTVGARLEFSPTIAIEPGFTFYYKQIAIDPGSGFTSHMNFFVKLCFRDLISFSE